MGRELSEGKPKSSGVDVAYWQMLRRPTACWQCGSVSSTAKRQWYERHWRWLSLNPRQKVWQSVNTALASADDLMLVEHVSKVEQHAPFMHPQ
jgi:hypothetical protein